MDLSDNLLQFGRRCFEFRFPPPVGSARRGLANPSAETERSGSHNRRFRWPRRVTVGVDWRQTPVRQNHRVREANPNARVGRAASPSHSRRQTVAGTDTRMQPGL